jgi:hypothetical protein
MGKSCIRFKKLDELDLKAIGQVIAETPVDEFIARYEASRKRLDSLGFRFLLGYKRIRLRLSEFRQPGC